MKGINMKMKISIGLLLLVTMVGVSSCYYDKSDLLYGGNSGPCTDSTGTVSYAQKIVPMLQQYCYSCHTGSFPSGNQLMGTYTADRAMALNGKLYGTMSHAAGFSPMPQGQAKLSNCQLAVLKKWIDSGTLNN
jgi:hypothetical protein